MLDCTSLTNKAILKIVDRGDIYGNVATLHEVLCFVIDYGLNAIGDAKSKVCIYADNVR